MTTYTVLKMTSRKDVSINVEAESLEEVMTKAKKLVHFREVASDLNEIDIFRPDQCEDDGSYYTLAFYRAKFPGSKEYGWTVCKTR